MAKDQVTSVDNIAHDDQKLKEKAKELVRGVLGLEVIRSLLNTT